MAGCNSVECISIERLNIYPKINPAPLSASPLSDQQLFRLNKINEVKDYFVGGIKERELMSERLSKYIASFNYFDNSLIFLSAKSGGIPIASFATVIGAPAGNIKYEF